MINNSHSHVYDPLNMKFISRFIDQFEILMFKESKMDCQNLTNSSASNSNKVLLYWPPLPLAALERNNPQ